MAGNAAHPARRGIVHNAAQHLPLLIVLRGCDARNPLLGRQKPRVIHAQRREDIPAGVVGQRDAGDFFHQKAESLEVDVAVKEPRAGRIDRFFAHGHFERCVAARPWGFQVQIFAKAGVMGQQVADRDVLLAILCKLGQVSGHGIVQPDAALLDKFHHRGSGCDALGERGKVEHSIDGHRLAHRFKRARSECLAVDDLSIVPDKKDTAGDVSIRDRLFHDRVQDNFHCFRAGLRILARPRTLSGCRPSGEALNNNRQTEQTLPASSDFCHCYPPE